MRCVRARAYRRQGDQESERARESAERRVGVIGVLAVSSLGLVDPEQEHEPALLLLLKLLLPLLLRLRLLLLKVAGRPGT